MMLFNKGVNKKTKTFNKEGEKTFKPSEKVELILRAATTMGQSDKFYETSAESDMRFVELIHSVARTDPEFILKLAYYTRKKFYLRTPATILLAEAARVGVGKQVPNATRYVRNTISRVDDMTELAAYCIRANLENPMHEGKLPHLIKRGIRDAFGNFDEYSFGKYTKDNMSISPKDLMCLVHPTPNSKVRKELYEKIGNETLAIPETWEQYIMIHGSTKESWTHILDHMGYLGIVRNLRNLIKHGVDTDDVVSEIVDRDRVLKSKMFPFQFYSAYRAVDTLNMDGASKIMGALSTAMDISVENFKKPEGTTAVFCDNSGSMRTKIHPKSSICFHDIGNVFGAMIAAAAKGDSIVCAFGTHVIPVNPNPRDSVLTNVMKIENAGLRSGGATYTSKCMEYVENMCPTVSRIIFFTDEQGYEEGDYGDRRGSNNVLNTLRHRGYNPYVYTFDLAHYGTTQFPENDPRIATIGGWSDNILKFIRLFETDRHTLVEDVENVGISG